MKLKSREYNVEVSTSSSCPYQFRPRQKTCDVGQGLGKEKMVQSKPKIKHQKKSVSEAAAAVLALECFHDKTVKTLEEINRAGNTTTPAGCIDHQLTDVVTGHYTEDGIFIMKHEDLSIPKDRDCPYELNIILEMTKRNFLSECEDLRATEKRLNVMSAIEKELKKQDELLCQQCDLLTECVNLQCQYFQIPLATDVPKELESLIEKYYGP